MCNINFNDLKFDHIVEFNHEQTVFACTRENGNGKLRLFLAFGNGQGRIYTRNGRAESWEILKDNEADIIRQRIRQATHEGIAVYQFNGKSPVAHPAE
jgi:hypothetical protein